MSVLLGARVPRWGCKGLEIRSSQSICLAGSAMPSIVRSLELYWDLDDLMEKVTTGSGIEITQELQFFALSSTSFDNIILCDDCHTSVISCQFCCHASIKQPALQSHLCIPRISSYSSTTQLFLLLLSPPLNTYGGSNIRHTLMLHSRHASPHF
jgi:hypothetical protein